MASKGRYRVRNEAKKHSNLYSQQRRLRHLTCIIGRNIDASLVPGARHSSKSSLLTLYFTIHSLDDPSIVLYRSESIENTLNPNWKEFDSKVFFNHPQCNTESSVRVLVWGARKSTDVSRVILQYDVHFSGLVYVHDHLRKHGQSYENNSLLFQLFGGYYAAPTTFKKDKTEERMLTDSIKMLDTQVRPSYKYASLLRAHGVMKAIQQTQQQANQVKNQMSDLLAKQEESRNKAWQQECLMFKNELLRQELQELKAKGETAKKSYYTEKDVLQRRAGKLEENKYDLEQYISDMKVTHSAHVKKKEALSSSRTRLIHRRRQLIAELSYIYPIVETQIVKDVKREYSICGIRLPNSEDFVGENDVMLSVALGNVAHCVYMMAKFMDVPLRYPISVMGSRSSIVDVVTDKLNDKDRKFPLYSKGKEKFQFHYGVFLLNKNVSQLRYHNDLVTSDLRNTLENLKRLLEEKFGVRIVMKPGTNVVGQKNRTHNNSFNRKFTTQTSEPVGSSSPKDRQLALRRTKTTLPASLPEESALDCVDFVPYPAEIRPFRPRSAVLSTTSSSGLPSASSKGDQHPYIVRKGSQRKVVRGSDIGSLRSISPDLITASCDDIVRMAGQQQEDNKDDVFVSGNSVPKGNSSGGINCGEDCLSENHHNSGTSNDHNIQQNTNQLNNIDRPVLRRTLSDALIIPDPFEREPEEPHSVGSNLNLDNILV